MGFIKLRIECCEVEELVSRYKAIESAVKNLRNPKQWIILTIEGA